MKFLDYLSEEYLDLLKSSIRIIKAGEYATYEVFVNPTKSELGILKKPKWDKETEVFIRGLVDMKQKKLFVFNGEGDIHEYAYRKLKSKGYISDTKYLYRIDGWIARDKIRSSDGESYPYNLFRDNSGGITSYKDKDFDWLKPYLQKFTIRYLKNPEYPDYGVAYINFKNINEEYVATGKGLDNTGMRDKTVNFPIFKNPGSSDYKELRKSYDAGEELELRTIIDLKNKNIFVWDALDGVHIEGFNTLKRSGDIKLEPDSAYNLYCGGGSLKRGKNKLMYGEYLSFVEYIRYYGLSNTEPYKGTMEDIRKKAEWLKSYYTGSIKAVDRWGSPKIEIS